MKQSKHLGMSLKIKVYCFWIIPTYVESDYESDLTKDLDIKGPNHVNEVWEAWREGIVDRPKKRLYNR